MTSIQALSLSTCEWVQINNFSLLKKSIGLQGSIQLNLIYHIMSEIGVTGTAPSLS